MRCESHLDETMHFVRNAVDVSMILSCTLAVLRTRIRLYAICEPNTMFLLSKNYVRIKNSLRSMVAVCALKFSELLF